MTIKVIGLPSILLAILTLAACSQSMVATEQIEHQAGYTCRSNAGSYYLPKRLLSVTVDKNSTQFSISVNNEEIVNDPVQVYCLDFLLSAFSNDRIGVRRSANQLLERIYTRAEDKSKKIAANVIQAAGDLVAASKSGTLGNLNRNAAENQVQGGNSIAFFQFDPFNREESEAVNHALKEFGYCIYLETRNDDLAPWWSPGQCKGHVTSAKTRTYGLARSHADARRLMNRGVLYRPEISHVVKIMRRTDPGNRREPMLLVGSEHIRMPNMAPIFALGVNRAFFVETQADVEFQKGLLKNISIKKPSELNAFVDLPLYAAQVALSIPAASLAIFENDVANRQALIEANTQLIATLRKFNRDAEAEEAVRQGKVGIKELVVPVGSGGGAQTLAGGAVDSEALAQCVANVPDSERTPTIVETCRAQILAGE